MFQKFYYNSYYKQISLYDSDFIAKIQLGDFDDSYFLQYIIEEYVRRNYNNKDISKNIVLVIRKLHNSLSCATHYVDIYKNNIPSFSNYYDDVKRYLIQYYLFR